MHNPKVLSFISLLQLLLVCMGALPQSSNSQDAGLASNSTDHISPNGSLFVRRYYIVNTELAIDFWHQAPSIAREDVLMSIVEGLAKIFGADPHEAIPGLSTFRYKNYAFIHVQDLNPTVGRAHTYQDLADTLRGVGEYMTEYNAFWTSEFQVWEMKQTGNLKIGSGGVGIISPHTADAVSTGFAAQTGIPACNRGNQHCVT